MDESLERVTEKLKLLAKSKPLPDVSARNLHEDFLIRYAHETTAIEGNTLTLHETQVVLENGITVAGKLLREHLEVVNARDAMVWLEQDEVQREPITETTILHIHSIIMRGILDGEAGSYRRYPVRIIGSSHVPPNWVKVPERMERFVDRIAQGPGDEHPVSFAARAHIELAAIHPFIDGNGRVSRMIVNLLLMQSGYPPALYSGTNRANYLSALERAQTEGDDGAFIAITAEAVETVLDRYLGIVQMVEQAEFQIEP